MSKPQRLGKQGKKAIYAQFGKQVRTYMFRGPSVISHLGKDFCSFSVDSKTKKIAYKILKI